MFASKKAATSWIESRFSRSLETLRQAQAKELEEVTVTTEGVHFPLPAGLD